jgi:hypothetical protein
VSRRGFEAWVEVIEHQGASAMLLMSDCSSWNNRSSEPVSNRMLSGRIAAAAFKLSSVFREQPFTLIQSNCQDIACQ